MRGIRVNVSPIRSRRRASPRSMMPRIARLAKLLPGYGWHLDFLTPGWLVTELMPTLRELPIDYRRAYRPLPGQGRRRRSRVSRNSSTSSGDGTEGAWVKLTGIYRFSTAPASPT